MTKPVTFTTICLATFEPLPLARARGLGTHLAGAGLLIATRRASGWRFKSQAATIAAGDREQDLLQWLADRLPLADTLIGWQIDNHVVPALLEAAETADAAVAHHLTGRLARALRGRVVDVALEHGGSAAPPLDQVAADMAIAVPVIPDEALVSAWAFDRLDAVRSDLAAQAIGLWQFFLRHARMSGLEAEEATLAWLERQRGAAPTQRAGSEA